MNKSYCLFRTVWFIIHQYLNFLLCKETRFKKKYCLNLGQLMRNCKGTCSVLVSFSGLIINHLLDPHTLPQNIQLKWCYQLQLLNLIPEHTSPTLCVDNIYITFTASTVRHYIEGRLFHSLACIFSTFLTIVYPIHLLSFPLVKTNVILFLLWHLVIVLLSRPSCYCHFLQPSLLTSENLKQEQESLREKQHMPKFLLYQPVVAFFIEVM